MQSIVVAIELSTGYAETKRKAARGIIQPGVSLDLCKYFTQSFALLPRKQVKAFLRTVPNPQGQH